MGTKLAGIMAVVTFIVCGLFYWYYSDTQERIAILNENNAKLETAVATSEAAVESEFRTLSSANKALNEVNEKFANIRKQNKTLSNKLGRHDLGNLAENKPGLVEKVVTKATKKANRCFELLSGAELTEQEKGAKNGKAFNSECPWLFDYLVNY